MRISRRFALVRPLFVLLLVAAVTPFLHADGELKIADLGRCKLESGQYIEHCRIGYRTWGKLNASGSNAVLFPTWYQGRSEDLVNFFGPDRVVDTTRFFGVAFDALGNGVSSSPSNSDAQRGPEFPFFSIRDMVNAEFRVASEILRIKHAHAVVGISMGGFQTFEWAAGYPDFIDLAVPIVGTPSLTSRDLMLYNTFMDALQQDPGYNGGRYSEQPALTVINELIAINLTSPGHLNRTVPLTRAHEVVESMRHSQRQDANDRMWQLKAILKHDVLRGRDLQTAARQSQPRFLVIVGAQDHMVNPQHALDWAKALGAPVFVSSGDCGHQVFDCDGAQITTTIRGFLAGTEK